MFQHIADVRQAVRYAMSDYKGKNLPGFSLPKKVGRIIFLYKLNKLHILIKMLPY